MPTPVARELDLILTAPQQRVLDQLVGHVDPVTATVLAGELSLHHNTVREHLDVLVEHGLARRRARRGAGRGRPSWVYEAATARPGRRAADYLDLAEAFAENLSATSARPSAEARCARLSARSRRCKMSRAYRRASSTRACRSSAPTTTLSSTVSAGKGRTIWNVRPTPRRQI